MKIGPARTTGVTVRAAPTASSPRARDTARANFAMMLTGAT